MDIDEIIIECICGQTWYMDYEPTPDTCVGDIWRLNLETIHHLENGDPPERSYDIGIWLDNEGNQVEWLDNEGKMK